MRALSSHLLLRVKGATRKPFADVGGLDWVSFIRVGAGPSPDGRATSLTSSARSAESIDRESNSDQ